MVVAHSGPPGQAGSCPVHRVTVAGNTADPGSEPWRLGCALQPLSSAQVTYLFSSQLSCKFFLYPPPPCLSSGESSLSLWDCTFSPLPRSGPSLPILCHSSPHNSCTSSVLKISTGARQSLVSSGTKTSMGLDATAEQPLPRVAPLSHDLPAPGCVQCRARPRGSGSWNEKET